MNSQSNESSYDLSENVDLLSRNEDFLDVLSSFSNSAKDPLDLPVFLRLMEEQPSQVIVVVSQPRCPSTVRYRHDYDTSKRRHSLEGELPTYKGPAIYIPLHKLDFNTYIGVSLSTVEYAGTKLRYVHPYILESIDGKGQNDTKNNIVWYPTFDRTHNNILNFPDLRIVRLNEKELANDSSLRIFYDRDLSENSSSPITVTKRKIKQEYKLNKGLLGFFIGEKKQEKDQFPTIMRETTIVSKEMDLIQEEKANEDTASSASPSSPTDCSIVRYAPSFGFTDGRNVMIVVCSRKLDKRRYGDVQVKFQSATVNLDEMKTESIEIQENLIYITMPSLPSSTNGSLDVKIEIRQEKRNLGVIDYQYLVKNQCFTCQMNESMSTNVLVRSNSNKRQRYHLNMDDTEYDGVVPVSAHDNTPSLQHSKSETLSNRSPSSNTDPTSVALKRLKDGIHQLFQNNDLKTLLRSSRLFIIQHPELFHHAIENNYSDLITTFVSVAGEQLLRSRNDQYETPLLQGVRLNRVNFIRAFLQRSDANDYLYEVNDRQQNIFHLLAMNNNSDELFKLIIDYLIKNSVNIKEKFDCIDNDNYTPLQIAIKNRHISAVRYLIKYSDKEIVQTSDTLGENLIHFTVRYGDLTILKYLLEHGALMEQGKRSSLTMTSLELANSLKHNDMKEYLETIYPQPKVEYEENTSDND